MRANLGLLSPTHQVSALLIIIIASYLFFVTLGSNYLIHNFYSLLVLDPLKVTHSYQIWRLVSYGFIHDMASPMHVIFNSLLLYLMGPQLEEYYGEKSFLLLIIMSIVLGGILVCLASLMGISHSTVIGFSGATMGLMIAWGLTFPKANIYIFGLIPLSGLQMVYMTIGLEVIYAASAEVISSSAHFGGIIAGLLFSKLPLIKAWLKKLSK